MIRIVEHLSSLAVVALALLAVATAEQRMKKAEEKKRAHRK